MIVFARPPLWVTGKVTTRLVVDYSGCCCCFCCFGGFSAKDLPEGDPCERQHSFRVGGKDLEGWRRTSKYVLPSCIEPGAPS